MKKLSERQELFLRVIAVCKHGWTPGDRWADQPIDDGMTPEDIPTVGGGGDANALAALVRKGLAIRPRSYHYYVITDAGREEVEKIRKRKAATD